MLVLDDGVGIRSSDAMLGPKWQRINICLCDKYMFVFMCVLTFSYV
jgi:hypothetical protein